MDNTRPVVVIGPGAVGTMLAAQLQKNLPGQKIYLAGSEDPSPETSAHLAEIKDSGVRVHGEAAYTTRPSVCRGAMDLDGLAPFFHRESGTNRSGGDGIFKNGGRGNNRGHFLERVGRL